MTMPRVTDRFGRVAAILLLLSIAGCHDAPMTPLDGSGFVRTVPTDGSAMEVPDPIFGEGSGSGDPLAALRHTHQLHREPLSPQDAVSGAVYRARYEAAQDLIGRLDQQSGARAPVDGDAARVRLSVGSNVHGETEDCGCRHNPLGGLARRATMLGDLPEGEPAIQAQFHFDAGDLLFKSAGSGAGTADPMQSVESVTALAILEGLTTMGIDALVPGPYDFSLGAGFLRAIAVQTHAPYVCANARIGTERMFEASRVIDHGGFRVGVVGVQIGRASCRERV
jgi:hypothetical protein